MSAAVSSLQALLDDGQRSGVFPSAQAIVLREGETIFEGHTADVTLSTVFDLASLTKILSTTTLLAWAWEQRLLAPERGLSEIFPQSAAGKHGVTLEDLLFHRAGYAASVMLWADALRQTPELLAPDCPAVLRRTVRDRVLNAALQVEPERPNRTEAVYCDVGFMVLGAVLEHVAGTPLDQLFAREIAEQLGLPLSYRRLSKLPTNSADRIVPSGSSRPRELAPGQVLPAGPEIPRGPTRVGEVDDDNAWVQDGVAGHAGVFGTVKGVAKFGQFVLEELQGARRVAAPEIWQRMVRRDPLLKQSTRAMGFDTPSSEGSSVGSIVGRGGPLGAIGHLGFTGVSLWLDLDRQWVVALLTNRSYLGRHVTKIREFRPRFHDAVAAVLME